MQAGGLTKTLHDHEIETEEEAANVLLMRTPSLRMKEELDTPR